MPQGASGAPEESGVVGESLCLAVIPELVEHAGAQTVVTLIGTTAALGLWGTYMVKSRRVRATFVR